MSDGRGGPRAGVWAGRLTLVVPGLPQTLAGRWTSGPFVLAVWGGLAALVLLQPAGLVEAGVRGGWEERLALLVLALSLAGAWGWSWWDVRTGVGSPPLLRRLARSPLAVVGGWGVATLVLLALLAPLLAPHDPTAQGSLTTERLLAPSAEHPLGTDMYARDVLSRLLYGARISLVIGVTAAAVSVGLGSVLGAVAGYLGGWVDSVVTRLVDVMLAFPRLVLLIALVALFEPSLLLLIAVLALTHWPHATRLVRSEVLSLRERPFVEAGQALGFSRARILAGHILPNALVPALVAGTLAVGDTIVLEAGLSFLGLGVEPPTPSWGAMVADGRAYLLEGWWLVTFPGVAVVVTVLAFNLAGDGLRNALDPRREA